MGRWVRTASRCLVNSLLIIGIVLNPLGPMMPSPTVQPRTASSPTNSSGQPASNTSDQSMATANDVVCAPPEGLKTTSKFGHLPLSFMPNQGQTDPAVQFHVRAMGGNIFFTPDEVVLTLPTSDTTQGMSSSAPAAALPQDLFDHLGLKRRAGPPTVVRVHFDGANQNTKLVPQDKLPGIANFFLGNDQTKWRTNIPTYSSVAYRELYPGIHLCYNGRQGLLKGTYTVSPDIDPTQIVWHYTGGIKLHLDTANGNLVVDLPGKQTLTEHAPVAWQMRNEQRMPVDVHYTLQANNRVGFALGKYDVGIPLIIDPTLVYSTFLGGTDNDWGQDIAVDNSGNILVTGQTVSIDFPRLNALQPTNLNWGAFITKLSAQDNTLIYSTYLGGDMDDIGRGIAVDGNGNAYVTGYTGSNNFPTQNALQSSLGGDGTYLDAFIAKLSVAGNQLIYSTYFGGSGHESGNGIAVDSNGNCYVAGMTYGIDFPRVNAFQTTYGGATDDAFVAKLSATGTQLVYSTYLGGNGQDVADRIRVNSNGETYITGVTGSSNFPRANAYQSIFGAGTYDAFVTKLSAAGNQLVYSTYLGGTDSDYGYGIAIDNSGSAYVVGVTLSTNFPTANALQPANAGNGDIFVTKLSAAGNQLNYSTYLGGSASENAYGIAVDSSGNAYLAGSSSSTNFPTLDAFQAANAGNSDVIITKLKADGSLNYSSYLGSNNAEESRSVAVDSNGNAYVIGYTYSSTFPTVDPVQATFGGGTSDAFIAEISDRSIADPDATVGDGWGETVAANLTHQAQITVGGEINTQTGNYVFGVTDISESAPGQELAFHRVYSKKRVEWQDNILLGPGWTHNFNARLLLPGDPENPAGSGVIIYQDSNGSRETFNISASQGSIAYRAPLGLLGFLTFRADVKDDTDTTGTSGAYTLILNKQLRYKFNHLGRLIQVDHVSNLPCGTVSGTKVFCGSGNLAGSNPPVLDSAAWNPFSLLYDNSPTPKLLCVIAAPYPVAVQNIPPGVRYLAFYYNAGGHVAAVYDQRVNDTGYCLNNASTPVFSAPHVAFAYQAIGSFTNLTGVTDVLGKNWTYDYTHELVISPYPLGTHVYLLTQVTKVAAGVFGDPAYDPERVVQQHYDDQDRVVGQYAGPDPNSLLLVRLYYDVPTLKATTVYDGDSNFGCIYTPNQVKALVTIKCDNNGTNQTTVKQYREDPNFRLTRLVDASSNITVWNWTGDSGCLKNVVYPQVSYPSTHNPIWNYTCGDFHNITSVTDPLGHSTTAAYDPTFPLLPITLTVQNSPSNLVTQLAYTSQGSIVCPASTAPNGLLCQTIDPSGMKTTYSYDSLGQLNQTVVNVQGTTNPWENVTTKYGYDDLGRPTAVQEGVPAARCKLIQYDNAGHVVKTVQNYRVVNNFNERVTPSDCTSRGTDSVTYGNYSPAYADQNLITTFSYYASGQIQASTNPLSYLTSYDYDLAGRLKKVTNSAYLAQQVQSLNYTYDSVGNRISVTYPTVGSDTRMDRMCYDGYHRLVRRVENYTLAVGDPCTLSVSGTADNNILTVMDYDLNGNLLTVTEGFGLTGPDNLPRMTHFVYDGLNRRTQVIQNYLGTQSPANVTTQIFYDDAGNIEHIIGPANPGYPTNPGSNVTWRCYDALNRLVREVVNASTNLQNNTAACNASNLGNTSAADQDLITSFSYDALGRVTDMDRLLDGVASPPIWHHSHTDYYPTGWLKLQTDTEVQNASTIATDAKEDRTASDAYDAFGRVHKSVDWQGRTSAFSFDGADRLLDVTRNFSGTQGPDKNVKVAYTYDGLGRIKSQTDPYYNVASPVIHTTTYTYDDIAGKITTNPPMLTNPPAVVPPVVQVYDRVGNLTSVTQGTSSATYHYDGLYRQETLTTARNLTTEWTYDGFDHLVEREDAESHITQYHYNQIGTLKNVIENYTGQSVNNSAQPADHDLETDYTFDALGNLVTVAPPGRSSLSYEYDKVSRQTKATNVGQWTTSYDKGGRVVGQQDPLHPAQTLGYEGLDRLKSLQYHDPNTPDVTWNYFQSGLNAGLLNTLVEGASVRTTTFNHDQLGRISSVLDPAGKTVGYGYDAVGNRTSLSLPGKPQAIAYTYNEVNQLKTVTAWDSGLTQYSYDAQDRLGGIALPNGVSATLGYDDDNRLTTLSYAKGGTSLLSFVYTHYGTGNRKTVNETLRAASSIHAVPDWIGLYDPSTSTWHLHNSNTAGTDNETFIFGTGGSGAKPIAGDWDNDTRNTGGLYTPSSGSWSLRNSNTAGSADVTFTFGPTASTWKPIAGDWNQDGIDNAGLYDQATSTFYLKNTNTSGSADLTFTFGAAGKGWLPIAGDWNGDGIDTIGLYDQSTSTFYLRNSNSAGSGTCGAPSYCADVTFSFGTAKKGWLPIAGDWNADGTDTIGVYDPSGGKFYLKNNNSAGSLTGPDVISFSYGPTHNSTWLPVAGHWLNGSGMAAPMALQVNAAPTKAQPTHPPKVSTTQPPTMVPTATFTNTPTQLPTSTATFTPSNTPTVPPMAALLIRTATYTPTATNTQPPTANATLIPSNTPTVPPTATPTQSGTAASLTPTPTNGDLLRTLRECVNDQELYNSLRVKVEQGDYQAFIDEVLAQSGKKIDEPCANELITLATYLLGHPPTQALILDAVCSPNPQSQRLWRVTNPNPSVMAFTWDITGSTEHGEGIVSTASGETPGETYFSSQTQPGANVARLFVDGVQEDSKVSNDSPCPTATPTEQQAPTFVPKKKAEAETSFNDPDTAFLGKWFAPEVQSGLPSLTLGAFDVTVQRTITYAYDGLYRLKEAKYTDPANAQLFRYAYTYDLAGNRTWATYFNSADVATASTQFLYKPNNQLDQTKNGLTNTALSNFVYDAAGNLSYEQSLSTGTKVNEYSYDAANRLTQHIARPGASLTNTWTYAYNGLGDRYQQTTNVGGTNNTTSYVLDRNAGLTQVLAETTSGVERDYLYGLDVLGQQDSNGWSYFGNDGLGSMRQMTNVTGNVTCAANYEPYGTSFEQYASSSAIAATRGFAGELTDGDGQLYLRARYYNPSFGAFLSHDPFDGVMNKSGSRNGYSYVEGNVPNLVDTSGLNSMDWLDPLRTGGGRGPGTGGGGGAEVPAAELADVSVVGPNTSVSAMQMQLQPMMLSAEDAFLTDKMVEVEDFQGIGELRQLANKYRAEMFDEAGTELRQLASTYQAESMPEAFEEISPAVETISTLDTTLARFRGEPFAFGYGVPSQHALSLMLMAAQISQVDLHDFVDAVYYSGARGLNPGFKVSLEGERFVVITPKVFTKTFAGQLITATHELVHAQKFDLVRRLMFAGDTYRATLFSFGQQFWYTDPENNPQGLINYAQEEIWTERRALHRVQRYLGALTPQQTGASTRYINYWQENLELGQMILQMYSRRRR